MKTKQTTNGMYALLVVVAAFLATGIYFACSADDDFETNYEMETLANGLMKAGYEPETPEVFVGVIVNRGIATFTNEPVIADWRANFTVEWDSGYTGNMIQPFSHIYLSYLELNKDTAIYETDFMKRVYTRLTYNTNWTYYKELAINYSCAEHIYERVWSSRYNRWIWQDEGETTTRYTKKYSFSELQEHMIDSLTNMNP